MARRDLLLAVGFSLIVLGIVLRGLARAQRRQLALRRQHELDERKAGVTPSVPTHFERHFGNYANAVVGAGVLCILACAL